MVNWLIPSPSLGKGFSQKKTKMKVKFIKSGTPLGLAYFKDNVAEFDQKQADELIDLGFAEKHTEPIKKTVIDLPTDLPGRKKLIDVGITTIEEVKQISDFTEIKGIGKALAKSIKTYLEE